MGSADPEFATFYGLEIERPFFEAVQIAVGNRFYFTDAQLFGSATRTNVTIAAPVTSVSFSGGWSSAAAGSGFDVSGQQVSINAVDVEGNHGAGIQLNGTSRVVSVVGNKVRSNPIAISIAAGADQFTVVGNACFANARIDNAAGKGGEPDRHRQHQMSVADSLRDGRAGAMGRLGDRLIAGEAKPSSPATTLAVMAA